MVIPALSAALFAVDTIWLWWISLICLILGIVCVLALVYLGAKGHAVIEQDLQNVNTETASDVNGDVNANAAAVSVSSQESIALEPVALPSNASE